MDYRAVSRIYQNSQLFDAKERRLNTNDMLDALGDPTVDITLAASAKLLVDPTNGVSIGDAEVLVWFGYLVEDNDYVIISTALETPDGVSDLQYAYVHKSIATLQAGEYFDYALLLMNAYDVVDYTEENVRAFLAMLSTDCGYFVSVGDYSQYVYEENKLVMLRDYYTHVATTGDDSWGFFTIITSQTRQWQLRLSNYEGAVKIDIVLLDGKMDLMLLPQHLPKRITDKLQISPSVDGDGAAFYKVGNHKSIADLEKSLRLTPTTYEDDGFSLSIASLTATDLILNASVQGRRLSSEIKNELMEKAAALL